MATRVSELIARLEDQFSQKAEQIAQSSRAMGDSVDSASKSLDAQNNSLRQTAQTTTQFVQASDGVQKAINRTEIAFARMEERLERASSELAKGAIDQQKYNDIVATQTAIYEKVEAASSKTVNALRERSKALSDGAKATTDANKTIEETADKAGLSSQKMGILADEAHKFFDQVMSGGSAFQAAFYQLPNMIQVMGGFGGALETVAGWMVGPAGLVVAGAAAAAAVYKVGSSAEAEQEQLATLSQHLRATRDDYTAMASAAEVAARQLSAGSGLSLDDSRSVTTTFAAVPTIDSSSLTSLTQEARDLAEVMGETVPEAAKDMASAYADPAKAAQDFADKGLLGVHQGLVSQVKDLQDSGNRMEAWQLLMGQLESATRGAVDQGLTPFQQAVRNLKDAWAGPMEGVENYGNKIGDFLVSQATKSIDGLTGLINKVKELKGWMDSFQPVHVAYEAQQQQIQQGTSSGMSGLIDTVGQQIGANSDVISLAHRIQPVESATGQYDRTGAVVMSSAGAIGGMQVMPANAAGNDLTDPIGNVTAAERLLVRLYSKYSGNEQLVAMAYNWGEGNVDKYLQGQGAVPQSVQNYVQQVTGGQTYGATTLATMQGKVDDALKTPDGSTNSQRADQVNAIKQMTDAQAELDKQRQAGVITDADYDAKTQALTERLMAHKGALNDLRDPMQELAHQQQQATDAAWAGTAAQKAMVQVDQQVEEAARKMGQSHATAAQLLKAESNEQQLLTGQFNSAIDAMDRKTSAQNTLLSSYDASKGSLDDYLRSVEASDTVQATSIAGTQEQARQTAVLTDALKRQAEAQVDITTARKAYGQSLDLETIKAEATAIGQDSDAVSVQMAVLKERNALLENGADLTSKASQTDLDNVAAIQTATNAYQKQQDTLNELTSDISSAADTLSSSFTQALVNASNGGVTFKSAMQGVESQLISVIAKLALINPLLSAIDGKSRTTLGDVSSILSGASSPSISDGAAAISQDSGGWGWNPLASAGSSSSSASGLGGSSSWLSSGLKTNLFGTATVGNLLGGIGGGFGIGSALSGIGGGSQTNGLIGSGLGAAAGAVAGSFIPVIGTMLGGVIGGGLGGLLGGLFSKTHYVYDSVQGSDGQLSIGSTRTKHASDDVTAGLQDQLDDLNGTYSDLGISVSDGSYGDVGHYHKGKHKSTKTLAELLGNVDLTSSDDTFNKALQGGLPSSFESIASYESTLSSLKQTADALDNLGVHVTKFDSATKITVGHIDGYTGDLATMLSGLDGKSISTSDLSNEISTLKSLLDITDSGSESLTSQVEDLQRSYQNAARDAAAYGMDAQVLLDKGNAIAQQMIAAQTTKLAQSDQSVQARYLTATGDDEGADLLNQQVSADQQVQQLKDSWQSYLGDSYADNATYQAQMTDLQKTLAAERLQIEASYQGTSLAQQKEYLSEANQSVAGVFSNLASYVENLNTSDVSPLSAEQKYHSANDNLQSDYKAAMGGDYDALSRIQSDAQTLLPLAQSYLGSGVDYAKVYSQTLSILQSLSGMDTNKVTAALMQKLAQAQVNAQAQTTQAVQVLQKALVPEIKQMVAAMANR
ncbi:phage tail length tape measure family protein [Gluconobacter kondonii]|uniref:phage tail length tape measure family protein n=1 Tax=Gluconobacter kondonii TaxID=941463 RepID=UPI001B8AF74F|nr:phage tail length tape measure family protein [Gluconobacter kondonii]MBS1079240.1 phage tail length tape measure family protein [Gluconobacter kondonii]